MLGTPCARRYQDWAPRTPGFHEKCRPSAAGTLGTALPDRFSHPMTPPATDTPWVQVLDTQDMDQHAQAQQGWALQYEQLSPGQFQGRIHRCNCPR